MGSPLAARHSADSQFYIIAQHEYTFFARQFPTEYNNTAKLLIYCDNSWEYADILRYYFLSFALIMTQVQRVTMSS